MKSYENGNKASYIHTHTHTHICPNHAACEENDQNKGKQTYLKHT